MLSPRPAELTCAAPQPPPLQLQALGKGRKEGAGVAGGEAVLSGEDLRAQHKRRMLFGHMLPATPGAAQAPHAPAAPPLPPGVTGGASVADAPAAEASGGSPGAASLGVAGSPGASPAARSAAASGGTTPRRASEDVAGAGEVFPGPLAAGLAPPAPLASGAFGSTAAFSSATLPNLEPAASAGSEAGRPDPAASAPPGQQQAGGGAGGGSRGALPTPKWAAKLASKAQKGFHKLRDSLQE